MGEEIPNTTAKCKNIFSNWGTYPSLKLSLLYIQMIEEKMTAVLF